MRANYIKASLLAMLLASTAIADTSSLQSSGHGLLENDYVRAGVNATTGTLGSGGNTSPGLLYDTTGTGTFNTAYDYLTPGSPFDGFAVSIDGTNYTNNNTGTTNIAGNTTHYGTGSALDDMNYGILRWYGGVDGQFNMQNTYILGATAEHIEIETKIYMGVDATDVWFGRFIDPDARAADGDSSATDNVLGYGVIPDSNVAFSEATVSRYALGLYSTNSNVDAGITSPWSSEADGYTASTYTDSEGNPVNYGTGDDTIGLSWHWSGITSGDTLTANYAYIFGPSAFDAADTAMTAGAGGGGDTSSWGTLEDVGSATDAATASSTPTVVSTTDDGGVTTLAGTVEGTTTSATTTSTSGSTDITTVTETTPTTYTYTTVTTYTDTMSDGTTQTREETATTTEVKNYVVATETRVTETETTGDATTLLGDAVVESSVDGDTVTITETVTYTDITPVSTTTSTITKVSTTDLDGNTTVTESDPVVSNTVYNVTTTEDKVWTTAITTTQEKETSRVYKDGVLVPELTATVYHRDYDNQTVETTHGTPSVANGVQTVDSDVTTTTPTETTTTVTKLMVDTTTTTITTVSTDPDGNETTDEASASIQDVYNDVDVTVETGEEVVNQDITSTGKVDQMDAIDVASSVLHKNLGVTNGVGAIGQRTEHNGYTHTSSGFALGGTKITDNGTRLSFGGSIVSTESSADTSTIDMETKHVGLAATFDVNPVIDITVEANHASSDISYTRNVGTFFNNAGETTATDTWGSVMLKGSGDIVRPVLGYTAGRRTIDGLTETGDSLTALTHATKETDWNYATVGAQLNWDVFSAEALYHTDNTKELNLGIDYNISENTSLKGSTSLSSSDFGSTYGISAGLHIKF